MKQVIKEAMGDCSTIEEFRFFLRCQECGRTWHSSPVRFSKAGIQFLFQAFKFTQSRLSFRGVDCILYVYRRLV